MGQEPPPTSVSAARPVCEPVDKIPQLLYSNPTRYLEILLPNATSGGRGLLPQEADDTSRYVEADGKETTASPLLPPGRVARRGKAARGEGRPCSAKLINPVSIRVERYGLKLRNGQVIFESAFDGSTRAEDQQPSNVPRRSRRIVRGGGKARRSQRPRGAPGAPAACVQRARQAIGPFSPPG